jgi:beta-lactamase regulating signal transducer with metallopeptidase domain
MTTILSGSLTGPMAQAMGWALLHLLWQGVLVAAILAATLALMKRQSANARYLASCGAMIALLVLLVATAVRSYDPTPAAAPVAFPATVSMHAATLLDTTADPSAISPNDQPTTAQLFARAVAVAAPRLPIIVLIWATGVLLLSVRLLFGWLRAHELARRSSVPAGRDWQRAAARLADALGLRRGVELLESAAVEVPTVIGFLRPVILLPMATLSGLSTEQIEMILAHELAHIRRHDFLINLLQAVVETLLFYHPAVWWISHRARVEREHCCDDMAVAVCGNALQYARALTRLEEMRVDPVHAFIAANGGSLMTRIRRLIGERGESPNGPSRWAAGAALLTVLLALLAAPSIPLLADRQHADDPQPAPAAKAAHTEVTVHAQKADEADVETAAEPADESETAVDDAPAIAAISADTPEPPETPEAPEPRTADCPTPPVPPVPAVAPFRVRVRPMFAPVAIAAPRIASAVRPRVMSVVAPNVRAIVDGVLGGVSGGISGGVTGGVETTVDAALAYAFDSQDYEDDKDSEHHPDRKHSRVIGSGDKLSVDELIAMRANGVTPEYIQQMRAAGLGELTYGDVISMRANGVTPEYLAEMRKAGFEIKNARMLIGMHANGVTPEYVRSMHESGVDVKDAKGIISLRANGVTPEWIASMKNAGLTGMSARDLISLRANGVDSQFIAAMNQAGYKNLSMRDLITLKATGVTPAFIKAMSDAGYTNLSVHDLIRLAASGVNADYIHDLQKYRTNK